MTTARAVLDAIDRRFVDPERGVVLDYVGDDGFVDHPTADDLRADRPNALAWWTPAENGAFFTGIHLLALTRHGREDAALAGRARVAASALGRLASVGSVPGFVARTVADDLVTHPRMGSDDQTFPLVLGLWRYVRSGLAAPGETEELRRIVVGVVAAVRAAGWSVPIDGGRDAGFRGTFAPHHVVPSARLLLLHRIMAELDEPRRAEWLDLYYRKLHEEGPESEGLSRRGLLACGIDYGPIGAPSSYPHRPPFWTSGSAQLALAALAELEDDPAVRADLQAGLARGAETALPHVALLRWEPQWAELPFAGRWRDLLDLWRPQPAASDAVRVGQEQSIRWENGTPRKHLEDTFLRAPAWAALIAAQHPHPQRRSAAVSAASTALGGVDLDAPATSALLPLALALD
ncbi:hypothetical protein [Schumannella luteola]